MAVPPRLAPQYPLPHRPYLPASGQPRPDLPIAQALAIDGASHQGFSPAVHAFAVDLFHAACYWEAHECWEVLWRREPRDSHRRAALQGLILLSAARVKALQGRPQGAAVLHRRALDALRRAGEGTPFLGGVNVRVLLEAAQAAGVAGPLVLTDRDR